MFGDDFSCDIYVYVVKLGVREIGSREIIFKLLFQFRIELIGVQNWVMK